MKKIPPTPFARRNLDRQLTALNGAAKDWPSEHLRRAYEIAEKRLDPKAAKEMVIQAVRAADRALKGAYQAQLRESSRSALWDFINNCRAIANGTKPNRLRKEVRRQLDEAARSAFVTGADLETIQQFFCECKKIVEACPQDQAAHAIFKHLVTNKDDRTPGKYLLEGNRPKIALDYEILPAQTRSAGENSLAQLICEKAERLTAHDVFACLHGASLDLELTAGLENEPDIIHGYLAELDGLWTDQGLRVGRGNRPDERGYLSPFHEFAERVLLQLRAPRSRTFDPLSDEEVIAAKISLWEIARKTGDEPDLPRPEHPLLSDRTLRAYLERRPTFKKSR